MPITERHGNIQIDLLNDDLYIRRRDGGGLSGSSIVMMIPAREVADFLACVDLFAKYLKTEKTP